MINPGLYIKSEVNHPNNHNHNHNHNLVEMESNYSLLNLVDNPSSNLDNISVKAYRDFGSRRSSQYASNFSLTTNKASEGHEVGSDNNNISPINNNVNQFLYAKNPNSNIYEK